MTSLISHFVIASLDTRHICNTLCLSAGLFDLLYRYIAISLYTCTRAICAILKDKSGQLPLLHHQWRIQGGEGGNTP